MANGVFSGMANGVDSDQTAPSAVWSEPHMLFSWELWCTKFYDIYWHFTYFSMKTYDVGTH